MNRKTQSACNFNCLFEAKGHPKVTGSHVHCTLSCGNILEMVQVRVIVITDH